MITAEVVITGCRQGIYGPGSGFICANRTLENALDQALGAQSAGIVGTQCRSALRAIWHIGPNLQQLFYAFLAGGCNLQARDSLFVPSEPVGTGHLIDYAERRFVMRSVLLRCQVIGFLAVSMFGAQNVVAQEQSRKVKECSNATLHGSFGYTSTGTLLPSYVPPPFAGPFAEVGRQTFDGNGDTEATATLSANGNINQVTIQGTYTVNPDCTGSMTLNVSPLDATVQADFVIDDDGAELRVIGTDSGVVESRVYKKQCRRGCNE